MSRNIIFVVVKPFLSLKMRSYFKTRKGTERTKIWSLASTGPATRNDYAGEDRQQFP
jgi:hypothetical protein